MVPDRRALLLHAELLFSLYNFMYILVSGRKSPIGGPDVDRQYSADSKSLGDSMNKQTSNIVVARKPVGQMRSPKIVSVMLSSPVTLLTMSIRKGQFTQSKQIIKVI